MNVGRNVHRRFAPRPWGETFIGESPMRQNVECRESPMGRNVHGRTVCGAKGPDTILYVHV